MTDAPRRSDTPPVADDILRIVRDEVVRGFDRQERYNDKLDNRFETMVTKTEFKAEIGRVDAEHGALRKEVDSVEDRLSKQMTTGFEEIKEQGAARGAKGRWFTGTLLAAAGLLSGIVFNILSNLPKQ